MSVTFVTCYYFIDSPRRTPRDFIVHFKKLPLNEIPNLVIFTNKESLKYIDELNDHFVEHKYNDRVKIRLVEFDELYRKFPANYIDDSKCIGHSKIDFIKKVVEENPFNTDKKCWMDFGISHIARCTPQYMRDAIESMPDKIKIATLYLFSSRLLEEKKGYYNDYRCYRSAGLFSGANEAVLDLYEKYQKEFKVMIDLNVISYEELIFNALIEQNPSDFITYYATYCSLFKNSKFIQGNIMFMLKNIDFASNERLHDKGTLLIIDMLESMKNNKYTITHPHKLISFLFKSQICTFYSTLKNTYKYDGQTLDAAIASLMQALWDFKPCTRGLFVETWKDNAQHSNGKKYTLDDFYSSELINICSCVM